jgi:hypothetical protein
MTMVRMSMRGVGVTMVMTMVIAVMTVVLAVMAVGVIVMAVVVMVVRRRHRGADRGRTVDRVRR